MYEIFNAPYGTDLFWVYEEDTHIGFYDQSPFKINSITLAIDELRQFDEKKLEDELQNMFFMLHEIRNALMRLLYIGVTTNVW